MRYSQEVYLPMVSDIFITRIVRSTDQRALEVLGENVPRDGNEATASYIYIKRTG
jgi:hypothetical protein